MRTAYQIFVGILVIIVVVSMAIGVGVLVYRAPKACEVHYHNGSTITLYNDGSVSVNSTHLSRDDWKHIIPYLQDVEAEKHK